MVSVDDLREPLRARDLAAWVYSRVEQRVVVQHLLEVGDQPPLVDRVAREAAADVVVHASGRHGVERRDDGVERGGRTGAVVVSQEVSEAHRLRELRGPPEPAPLLVEARQHRHRRLVEGRRSSGGRRPSPAGDLATQRLGEAVGLLEQVRAPVGPRLVDGVHDLGERRMPAPALRWEVGAAEERARRPAS